MGYVPDVTSHRPLWQALRMTMASPETDGFEGRLNDWLANVVGVEYPRRVARVDDSQVLVSKFEPGFAANLHELLDLLGEHALAPELGDGEVGPAVTEGVGGHQHHLQVGAGRPQEVGDMLRLPQGQRAVAGGDPEFRAGQGNGYVGRCRARPPDGGHGRTADRHVPRGWQP